jgi:hypothetical protein
MCATSRRRFLTGFFRFSPSLQRHRWRASPAEDLCDGFGIAGVSRVSYAYCHAPTKVAEPCAAANRLRGHGTCGTPPPHFRPPAGAAPAPPVAELGVVRRLRTSPVKATTLTSNQIGTAPSRSPGERAFDRCFYPFGAILALALLGILEGIFANLFVSRTLIHKPHSEAELAAAVPDPAWHTWLPFILGVLLCVYWLWAFFGVLSTWRDPRARVLRFSALFLLLFDACIAYGLLTFPFPISD